MLLFFFISTLGPSLGFLNGGSKENGQNPDTMAAKTEKTQTSTAKFLWAAQGKRFKKIKKGTNRNLQGPCNCMQAIVTACKLL